MKNKKIIGGILVLILVFSMMISSCATYATRGGVQTPIGFFTPTFQADGGRRVVGSYTILFGLFTLGYRDFIHQTQDREIDIVDTNFLFIFRTIRAVERN